MAMDARIIGADWAHGDPSRLQVVSENDRRGRPLRTVIDMDTGLVRNDPIPGDEELARFYAEDYRKDYKGAAKPRRRQILRNFRRAADHIQRFRDVLDPVETVLDVGAGSGEFVFLMKEMGKDVVGIEPNAGYAEYCRDALDLDVRTAHLAPDLFDGERFDLVRLNHVLEHLNDPVGYLAMISEWVSPEGLLWVEVPNIETYAREKSKGNMFHFGHIFNFNPWTLRTAANLAGLKEADETVARSADTTGVFFRLSEESAEEITAHNPANGDRVRELIRRHYDGSFYKGKAKKPFVKLGQRIEETVTGLVLGGPSSIGENTARRL